MLKLLSFLSPRGRTRGTAFLLSTLALVGLAIAGHAVVWAIGVAGGPLRLLGWGALAWSALLIWAWIALILRRLHDVGATWRSLVVFIAADVGGWWLTTLFGAPAIVAGFLVVLTALVTLGYLAFETSRAPPPPKLKPAEAAMAARQIGDRMRAAILPTLLLRQTPERPFSKLGGRPELPLSMDWPNGREAARCFIAQIDLAEVRCGGGPDWLPPTGRLYFFYDEDGASFADQVACYASHDAPGPERLAPDGHELKPLFHERRVAFEQLTSLPSLDWLGVFDLRGLPDDVFDELNEAPERPFGDAPQHRIGGYPSEIQSAQMAWECEFLTTGTKVNYTDVPPAIAEGAKSWRLLLQIDSDDDLGMNWVDTGRLYVFIREEDARAGAFSKTATIVQFH